MWGPSLERMQRRRARGKETPGTRQALDNQPKIEKHLEWIFTAFYRLSEARQMAVGMSAVFQPISIDAIDRYATRAEVRTWSDFDYFLTLIQAMDRPWREHHNKPKKPKGRR